MGLEVTAILTKYDYVQATQPTDLREGVRWYDTSNNVLKISNGTSFSNVTVSTEYLQQSIIENALNILEIQATDTLTAVSSATIASDVFSDTTGYLDTVNTGNTTAIFDTDTYKNDPADASEAHGQAMGSYASITGQRGFKITVGASDIAIASLTKATSSGGTTAYIYASDGSTLLGSATYSGNTATFSSPISLSASTTYFIGSDAGGASYDPYRKTAFGYPKAGTYFNWVAGWTGGTGEDAGDGFNIVSAGISNLPEDKIVETDAITLPSTPTKFQVYAYNKNTTGTGSVSASVSFDNGSNYQDVDLDTEENITNQGTQMIVRIKLNAGASNGLAECDGYGVLFW